MCAKVGEARARCPKWAPIAVSVKNTFLMYIHMYMYMYMCIYIYIYIYVFVYIYREREREVNLCPAIQRQTLLSSPRFGTLKAYLSKSCFFGGVFLS